MDNDDDSPALDTATELHRRLSAAASAPDELEFDGQTVLCRVCGDRASGFHYGVHACEGCKGFFRRSIQQKIHYRPCLKNQMCLITRVNRNRCQYCRLKKCIAVGMSRDAVRFGRVPKREKAKILEQMQRVNVQYQGSALDSIIADENRLRSQIVDIHLRTCPFTAEKFRTFFQHTWSSPVFVQCSANVACPLNPVPEDRLELDGSSLGVAQRWNQFSDCFMPAIRCVVDFARCIPGFQLLSHDDQVTLLKAGTFEVLLVHLSCLFDAKTNTMLFTNGKIFRRMSLMPNTGAGFLLNSMFDFAERFNELRLTDEETALFSALIIISSDRPGLRGVDLVERLQAAISRCLQNVMNASHPDDPSIFAKLLIKISDLRTLNTIHSDKLLGLVSSPGEPDGNDDTPVLLRGCKSEMKYGESCVDGLRQCKTEFDEQSASEPCPRASLSFDNDSMVNESECEHSSVESPRTDCPSSTGNRSVLDYERNGMTVGYFDDNVEHNERDFSAEQSSVNLKSESATSLLGKFSDHAGVSNMPHDALPFDISRGNHDANLRESAEEDGGKAPHDKNPENHHCSGSSVVGHQTALRDQPRELILATPFGTFHRAPQNLWSSGMGRGAATASTAAPACLSVTPNGETDVRWRAAVPSACEDEVNDMSYSRHYQEAAGKRKMAEDCRMPAKVMRTWTDSSVPDSRDTSGLERQLVKCSSAADIVTGFRTDSERSSRADAVSVRSQDEESWNRMSNSTEMQCTRTLSTECLSVDTVLSSPKHRDPQDDRMSWSRKEIPVDKLERPPRRSSASSSNASNTAPTSAPAVSTPVKELNVWERLELERKTMRNADTRANHSATVTNLKRRLLQRGSSHSGPPSRSNPPPTLGNATSPIIASDRQGSYSYLPGILADREVLPGSHPALLYNPTAAFFYSQLAAVQHLESIRHQQEALLEAGYRAAAAVAATEGHLTRDAVECRPHVSQMLPHYLSPPVGNVPIERLRLHLDAENLSRNINPCSDTVARVNQAFN